MSLLDRMNAAREERRAGEEETLAKGTPPLPYTAVVPPDPDPLAGPVQSISEPEGGLETARRIFFDPGWLLDRDGKSSFNPFTMVKKGAEVTAEVIDEAVTNRRKEQELADQGVDVRHKGLTDAQGDAVRSIQGQTANILSMYDLEPEFVSNTLNGVLSAKFNKVEEDAGSDTRYAPSQFQVAVDTDTGRLLFTHPVTRQRTPIDSFAVTSEDFTHVMEQMKPFLLEAGLGAAGTAVGAVGGAFFSRNPAIAARAATVTGGLAEIFGAVFAKYDQRVSALRLAGYRPVRWNMEENREDASAPLRWMFYNAGRGLDGRNEPFPDPGEKSWLDTNVFLEGAETTAAWALGGQVAMKGLYGLYRLSSGGPAGKEIGDIASARDFEKALRQRDIEVGQGEVLKQNLNTPQVMFNYADHLALQASEETTKGNFRRARKLRDEASYYRRIGDDYNNKLNDLGVSGSGQAQANIDQAGVEEIRKVTGVDPELRIPGSATGEVVDEQLIGVGRRVINTVTESDAQKVATNLNTMRGASDNLRQQLIEQGRVMRGGPEVSGAGTTLDVFPSQSPSIKLQQAFDDTKAFLVGGDNSWWSTQINKPANKALQDLVGGGNITIRAPDALRMQRASILRQGISSRVDEFTKYVAQTVNLPQPKMVGRNVQFGGPKVEVTTNLKDVSSMLRQLRILKGEVANSANDMRVANQLEDTLLDLRKRLVQGSPKYLEANQAGQAAIKKALRGLDEADALYNETMGLYSRGRIGKAMQIANQQPVGPTDQRSTSFFQALIPPNSSAEDVGMLLTSLNRSDIGLRAADNISAEQLLRSGLYQTYLNKVVGEEDIAEAVARRETGKGVDESLKRVFDIEKHRKFMSEYGPVLRALTPAQGDRSADEVFQELNDRPEALYKIVRDNLDARKKLEKALNESSSLRALGIDPARPDIAVSDVLTTAPENYGALRKLVGDLEIDKGVKKTLLKDMDDSVKSMFVRMITTRTPGRGVSIDPTLLQEALQRVRAGGEEAFRFRSALEVVYSKGELEQMGKIAQGLEVLNQSARTGTGLPDLKGTLLDNRKPMGAIARWYVGVLNERARALTSVQRVVGRKTEQVLLKALTDPTQAQKLLKSTISKAGLLGRSILNLVGATTGVYFSQEEAEDLAEFSKLGPIDPKTGMGDISRERLGGPAPYVDRDRSTNYRDLRTPMKIPELNIPSASSIAELPVVGQYIAPYVGGQTPATITAPRAVQQGLGNLQQRAVNVLRDVEQRKLAGVPAPMNKGGIVNARPRRQTVL
jgi:hypothetical protein